MSKKSIAAVAVTIVALLAAVSATAGRDRANDRTLVIDTSSQLKTLDPGREYETTGQFVTHQVYDTLVSFANGSVKTVVPALAGSFAVAKNHKSVTMHLRKGVRFSDGTKLTSADVVFSLDRLANIKGNGAFLMDGLTVSAPNASTVVISSTTADPTLLFKLASPSMSILNSKVVKAQGGSDAADASTSDTAEAYLDQSSAGTGPYVLVRWTRPSQVVLQANPRYWGKKPAFAKVIVNDATASVQRLDVQRGAAQLALDLSAADASGLQNVQVVRAPTADIFWMFVNGNPAISKVTSNPKFQEAVRYGIDYNGMLQIAGQGAKPLSGIISSVFNGSLSPKDALKRNVARAKKALAASGISDPTMHLYYPSDVQVDGISFGDLAARIQQNLKDVGINVVLQPQAAQTALVGYRAGTEEAGVWETGPSIPMENAQLVWLPGITGNFMAHRTGWDTQTTPPVTQLGKDAAVQFDPAKRAKLWQRIQLLMQQSSPVIPLFQPAKVLVASKSLKGVVYSLGWIVDVKSLH